MFPHSFQGLSSKADLFGGRRPTSCSLCPHSERVVVKYFSFRGTFAGNDSHRRVAAVAEVSQVAQRNGQKTSQQKDDSGPSKLCLSKMMHKQTAPHHKPTPKYIALITQCHSATITTTTTSNTTTIPNNKQSATTDNSDHNNDGEDDDDSVSPAATRRGSYALRTIGRHFGR